MQNNSWQIDNIVYCLNKQMWAWNETQERAYKDLCKRNFLAIENPC